MTISIPHPPLTGPERLAVILNDNIQSYLGIFEPNTGKMYKIPGGPKAKNYYPTWSPDSTKIAYLSGCREDHAPVEV